MKAGKREEHILMNDPNFRTVLTGAREFTLEHASWINLGLPSDTYGVRDLLKCQDMFLRSEISTEEDMKVSGISRLWLRNGVETITETRAEVGLWQVSPGLFNWAQNVGDLLKQERDLLDVETIPRSVVATIYLNNRDEVADDPLIIGKLLDKTQNGVPGDCVCIVTQDRKLCAAVARKCGISVYRLSTYAIPLLFPGEDMEEKARSLEGDWDFLGEYVKFSEKPRIIYSMVDTGSLFEMLMKHTVTDIGEGRRLYSFQSTEFFQSHGGKRKEILSYELVRGKALTETILYKMKDGNGNRLLEVHRPQKTVLKKLPKFESYARGSDASSKRSTNSRRSRSSKRSGYVPSEKE
jgi:hypothetical protein